MDFLYWLLHGVFGCPSKNMDSSINNKREVCRKCKRTYFTFEKY